MLRDLNPGRRIEVGEKISTNIEHCTADILFEWFGFNQTYKSVDNFNWNESTQSKPVKQEMNHTVILPFSM